MTLPKSWSNWYVWGHINTSTLSLRTNNRRCWRRCKDMTVNYLSCFLFCLCVTYAGAAAAQRERSLPQWLWNPCSGNEKEQLHLPAAIDWLDNAQVRAAVDLFSWVFNLAKMSRWIKLTVDVAQLRPEPSPWLWNMSLKRLLLRFSPCPWAHAWHPLFTIPLWKILLQNKNVVYAHHVHSNRL